MVYGVPTTVNHTATPPFNPLGQASRSLCEFLDFPIFLDLNRPIRPPKSPNT